MGLTGNDTTSATWDREDRTVRSTGTGRQVTTPSCEMETRNGGGQLRRRLGAVVVVAAMVGTLGAIASEASADPPALSGIYAGTATGDFGSTAALNLQVSGTPDATTATATLAGGARIDCNGDRAVDPAQIVLSGSRTVLNSDGSSAYELTGRFEFNTAGPFGTTVHVIVDVAVHGTLSVDGQSFAGPLGLFVQPSLGGNCLRPWSFTTTNNVRIVPDVIDLKREPAKAALLAQNLQPSFRVSIDRTCNHNNTVWLTHPRAGTIVPVGSTIDVVIGVRDRSRPCP
jgi:hypothetical protein